MEITGVYKVIHPAKGQHMFFSATPGNFSQIDHILGHKESLKRYKKIEISLCTI
jgi:hypothetical protein